MLVLEVMIFFFNNLESTQDFQNIILKVFFWLTRENQFQTIKIINLKMIPLFLTFKTNVGRKQC